MESGSEIHRLKSISISDINKFNRLYKKVTPLVKKLSRNVDERRFNVSKDIIQSYFWDKFLYVYNKYQDKYDENRLKATIISSLSTFKNRLLRSAYNNQSEYFQGLISMEDVLESDKELIDDTFIGEFKEELTDSFYNYMKANLSPDAYLLLTTQLNPPPFIKDRLKNDNSRVSIVILLEFFGLEKTKSNANFISKLRKEIEDNIGKAKNHITI